MFLLLLVVSGCRKSPASRMAGDLKAPKEPDIRVLLLNDVNQCQISSYSSFQILDSNNSPLTAAGISDANTPQPPLTIGIAEHKFSINGAKLESGFISISPKAGIFALDGDDYRGKIKVILNEDANSFDVINIVPLEKYLAGVVGAEMYSYWELEALKAQAVVARTYCLYIQRRFGGNRQWDVKKNQASQAYHGIRTETMRVCQAVEETSGEVLACNQQGVLDIFPAYYSSNCGGHTEDSTNVFGGKFLEPLKGVDCPFCRQIAKPRFFDWQQVSFAKTYVNSRLMDRYPALKALEKIEKLEPVRQSDYDYFSRLTYIKLTGTNGKTESLRAEDLRLGIDSSGLKIKSAACRIADINDAWVFSNGRGYGHGVGLCQCGAEYIARRGKDYKNILLYYYPGSEILKLFKDE